MNKQHIQVPNPQQESKLKPIDWYVYAHIRKYMNEHTKMCYPTMDTLQKDTRCNIKVIRRSIKNLVAEKEITLDKIGKKYYFTFNPFTRAFEMFTPEFLKQKLEPELLGYLMGLQSHSYKNGEHAIIKKTQKEIAKSLNISTRSVRLYNTKLKEQNIILTGPQVTDIDDYSKNYTIIDLKKICQAVLFVNEKVDKVKDEVDELKNTVEILTNTIKDLEKEVRILKKEKIQPFEPPKL